MQLILFFSFQITSSTVVCSKHFKADDYKGWNSVGKRLNPTAVPAIFEWKADQVPRRLLSRKLPIQSTTKADESIGTVLPEHCVQENQQEIATILIPTHVLAEKDYKIENLEEKLEQTNKEADDLRHQLKLEKFAVTRFCHDDTLISSYTGCQSYDEFVAFFQCIEPAAKCILPGQ
jgi:hypothetical protein